MGKTVNERLTDYIYSKHLSVNAFSKTIGVSQTTLNPQANGTVKVNVETLSAIARQYPDANMRWFLTGTGDMECHNITQNNSQGHNIAGNNTFNTMSVDTLLDIIKKLQEENASLIRLLTKREQ